MKKFIAALFLSGLFGCELAVDIDVPVEKPRLTLNSFFTPDSLWNAKLSLSHHILDNNPAYKIPGNVLIVMYEQGKPIDTLNHTENGIYRSDTGKPLHPGTFEVRAESGEYRSVRSESYIPEVIEIDSVDVETSTNAGHDTQLWGTLYFTDKPGEKNYYQILIVGKTVYKNPQTGEETIQRFPVEIDSDDPAFDNESGNSQGIFKDVIFDGKKVALKIKGKFWEYYDPNQYTLTFYLRSLSEDYYRYETTLSLQNNTADDPFAQPVSVYNNIENGFGVFAGYSQSVFGA